VATFDEAFLYPLYLLLIGAVASVGLGTWLTHWLENRRKKREIEVDNRRKEMEIKVDIVSKMTDVIAYQKANALISIDRKIEVRKEDDEIAATGVNLRKWYVDANIISSKLQTYFPETGLREKWEWYYLILLAFTNVSRDYFLEHTADEHNRGFKHRLESIRDYFSNEKEVVVDWSRFTTQMTFDKELWGDVGNLILKRGDEIVRDVLKSHIRAF
jgi:hypothetical protein